MQSNHAPARLMSNYKHVLLKMANKELRPYHPTCTFEDNMSKNVPHCPTLKDEMRIERQPKVPPFIQL